MCCGRALSQLLTWVYQTGIDTVTSLCIYECSYNKVVMEGYLKRKLGGIFVKWRKCWAVLLSNGHLNLSKNKDTDCFASINVCEFQELTYAGDDLSFALSSVIGGTIEVLLCLADRPFHCYSFLDS